MAWFIGQSAVMILLAFLLGLLVGWIIWGRRVRALLIEVRELRALRAECEANHGAAAEVATPTEVEPTEAEKAPVAEAVPAPIHIPAPRTEVADASELDTTVHVAAAAPLADDSIDDSVDGQLLDDDVLDPFDGSVNGAADSSDDDADGDDGDLDGETVAVEPVDDFVRIEGIGPKIAAALVAAGIRTYRQLANARSAALTSAINNAGITFAPSLVTWSQQARLLADGDEAGFLTLTDRLIAGRNATAAQNGAAPAVEIEDLSEPEIEPLPEVEPLPEAEPAAALPEAAPSAEAVSEPLPEPLPEPDDLARIEGIGPKIAGALVTAGVRTFGQLADADPDALRNAINEAGITFAPSLATWPEQARLLADGHEDEFAVLTARLIAGRRADDDLQRIEGIGPKMAAALHAAGIRTYRALAESSDAKLRNAISGSGLKFAPSIVTWSRQARLLADGDEEGFTDLTRRLVAGRDDGRA